jgi:hypothetical protein
MRDIGAQTDEHQGGIYVYKGDKNNKEKVID